MQYYGRYVYYGGITVIIASILTFIVEFMRLYYISSYHKPDRSELAAANPHADENLLTKWEKEIEADPENVRAIQMGNKESLIFIYMLNCTICVLFLFIGLVMYSASKPALQVVHYLQLGVDVVPEELQHHVEIE